MFCSILNIKWQQGNSVARDLPRTGSETNTTIFVIYILDIDSHCPYLLSGEITFQLIHVKIPYMYIYDLEKPPPPFDQ